MIVVGFPIVSICIVSVYWGIKIKAINSLKDRAQWHFCEKYTDFFHDADGGAVSSIGSQNYMKESSVKLSVFINTNS